MAFKPSIFDIKYQNMNQEETLLNYERDMMLYEQTEALEKMQKAQEEALKKAKSSNASSSSYYSHTGDYDLSDDEKIFEINSDIRNTDIERKISGKKIDNEIDLLFSMIKIKMKTLEFWNEVKDIIIVLTIIAVSISLVAVPLFFGDSNTSIIAKKIIIIYYVTTAVLYLISKMKIKFTKNEILRLYNDKRSISQEINNKKSKNNITYTQKIERK